MKQSNLINAMLATIALVIGSLTLNAQNNITDTTPAAEETVTFQDFLQQFPAQNLPYSITEEDLQAQLTATTKSKAKRLSWEYYQFIPTLERSAQTSRMTVYPEPIAAFETADNFAVLYNLARGLSKGNKCLEIAVFDKEGNFIASRVIAGVNANTLTAAQIDEALNATVKAYEINWASDVRENGIDGNEIIGLNLIEKENIDLKIDTNEAEWHSSAITQDLLSPAATASK